MIKRIIYQLYLFQLENYNLKRYFRLLPKALFSTKRELRQKLVWTPKLLVLTNLAFLLIAPASFFYVTLFSIQNNALSIFLFLFFLSLCVFFYPVFLIIAALILRLPETVVKKRIVARATGKMKKFPNLKVIGIAGSYGKTTMKEAINAVLSEKYRVLKTPENINTPLGIAELIQTKLDDSIEVFIVEMGEYERGDIEEICKMVRPKIGIITGINEAHLERMGSIENTIKTIFELAENISDGGKVFLNADDELIVKNYKRFSISTPYFLIRANKKIGEHHVKARVPEFYSASGNDLCKYKIERINFNEKGSGYDFEVVAEASGESFGEFHIFLFGEYAIGVAVAGIIVGQSFDMDMADIKAGIWKIKSPKHRLELVPTTNGVTVIDDSYNGNPAGALAAMEVLSKFKGRRKIYVTPGLVEMGPAAERVHVELGRKLGKIADIAILIKNSVTGYIMKGLESSGFDMKNAIVFDSAVKAHAKLAEILKPGDVVLFQNDWPDNYY
ncbi:MAG: UDP-N-acetylmuramoyl-tripeptide--D-alanyl-D-alanine ligase [Candidatus Liptonbacteria bacterium]|nr:UDP-N-acetylmuramoyl-tripeptide--D-alanyl-D-alanine ligase [Candidatus Liptonbacteria bacterium]